MKYIITIFSIFFFSTVEVLAVDKKDCSNLKKFSIQYTWCKSKNLGNAVKSKIGNINKNKTNKDKK